MSRAIKIIVRAATLEDYAAAHKLHCLPGVIRGTLQLPFPTLDLWKQRMGNLHDRNKFFLVATVEEEVLGMLSLELWEGSHRRRHVGSFGMCVHDDWQGKGIGNALVEGTLRKYAYRDGVFADVYAMARLRV